MTGNVGSVYSVIISARTHPHYLSALSLATKRREEGEATDADDDDDDDVEDVAHDAASNAVAVVPTEAARQT